MNQENRSPDEVAIAGKRVIPGNAGISFLRNHSAVVHADSGAGYPVYVEPGVTVLRASDGTQQLMGKVMIGLRNGNVWGFPTLQQIPYLPPELTRSRTSPVPGCSANMASRRSTGKAFAVRGITTGCDDSCRGT
ncbi:MAG TPA: hypothetical protein VMB66_03895 [Candidatus Acidoferrales bacterium]|nr:hypothetical protein [Candidatus Acidoferrales bacterium]